MMAKQRLSIPELAERRGWSWRPGKACRVPWREDRSPSGSVLSGGLLLHDFASGETYDGPALLAKVEGMDMAAAARLFIALAGILPGSIPHHRLALPAPATVPPPRKPSIPRLSEMRQNDITALARLRGLEVPAIREAARRGLLWRCCWRGFPAWLLADESGWICQARRMDGMLFPRRDGASGVKAWTLPGSRAGWPLGAVDACRRERVALVEGGPDMLAALHLANAAGMMAGVGVCAMLGAGCRMAPDALPYFRGKRVRIFPHADIPRPDGTFPGIEGAARWQEALTDAGAVVDAFDISGITGTDGHPLKDLNDVAREWPRISHEEPDMAACMDF